MNPKEKAISYVEDWEHPRNSDYSITSTVQFVVRKAIDIALTEINKMERSAKIQAETAKEQRTEAEKECEDYKGFKNLQKRISWFRTFADKVEAGQKKIALLTRYVTTLETVERNILLVAWTDEIREKVEGIEERKLELDKRSEAVNVLFTHYRNLTENNKIIVKANNFRTLLPVIASLQEKLDALEERKRKAAKLRQLVSKLEEATSQVDVETINLVKQKIQGIVERLKALEKRKEKRADLWNLVRNLEVFEERIEKFEEETSEARAELAELLPEECPICGTPKEEWRKNNA